MRNLEWNMDDALQARFEDGMELGMKQGRNEERENFAVKLIRRGSSFDEIHELTDLPLQRIQELANDNRNN